MSVVAFEVPEVALLASMSKPAPVGRLYKVTVPLLLLKVVPSKGVIPVRDPIRPPKKKL
jgi:hypothetical protein